MFSVLPITNSVFFGIKIAFLLFLHLAMLLTIVTVVTIFFNFVLFCLLLECVGFGSSRQWVN